MLLVWVIRVIGFRIFGHFFIEVLNDLINFLNSVPGWFFVVARELEQRPLLVRFLDLLDDVANEILWLQRNLRALLQVLLDDSSNNLRCLLGAILRVLFFNWLESFHDVSDDGFQIFWRDFFWQLLLRGFHHEHNWEEPIRHSCFRVLDELFGSKVRLFVHMSWEWFRCLLWSVWVLHIWNARQLLDVGLLRFFRQTCMSKDILDDVREVVFRRILRVARNVFDDRLSDDSLHRSRRLSWFATEDLLDFLDDFHDFAGLETLRSIVFGFRDSVLLDDFNYSL